MIINAVNVFSAQACTCMRLACITKPICRLKRLFSFWPLKVMAPVLRMALHTAYLLECKQIHDFNALWHGSRHTGGQASWKGAYLCALEPMMLRSVVFPLPLGPIKANTSFGRQQPVMLNRICRSRRHVTGAHLCCNCNVEAVLASS